MVGVALSAISFGPTSAQQRPAQPAKDGQTAQSAVLHSYCVTCHSDKARTGGLTLEHADLANIPNGAQTWEKVIRKVRAGMMPPPGMPRPDKPTLDALSASL